MLTQISINRSGLAPKPGMIEPGVISFDPSADNHYFFAVLLSGHGDIISISEAQAKLRANVLDPIKNIDMVLALWLTPGEDATVMNFRVCNLSRVYALSNVTYDESMGGTPRYTLLFQMIEEPGRGAYRSAMGSAPILEVANATYFPPEDMIAHEAIFRPSYDIVSSPIQQWEPSRSRQWRLAGGPPVGADQSAPAKLFVTESNGGSESYEVLVGRKFTLIVEKDRPTPWTARTISHLDDGKTNLYYYAHFHSPIAVRSMGESEKLIWLAWHKPAGVLSTEVLMMQEGSNELFQSLTTTGFITMGPGRLD